LTENLEKGVAPVIEAKRPLDPGEYEADFPIAGDESDTAAAPVTFETSRLVLPFTADVPKSGDPDSEVKGTVTLKL
jgi:hypothetical protein